jgi:hypothetical protein
MTITVEDGTIVANADSYVPVAFADAYFAFDGEFAATWSAYTTTEKENYLKWATRVLDQKVQWKGTRYDEDSSLRWPREGVYDRDGNEILETVIPLQLKQATCEMAKYLTTTDATTDQGVDTLKRVAVDVIEIEYQESKGISTVPPIFNQLLRGLGHYPSALGSQFGRILKA